MEVLGLIILFVVVYLYFRGKEKEKIQQQELAHPIYSDHFADAGVNWRVDFGTMQMEQKGYAVGKDDVIRQYQLRRDGPNQWFRRLTDASWKLEITWLKEKVQCGENGEEVLGLDDIKEQLEELAAGPVWQPFQPEFVAELDTDYLRYVAQYKD